MKIDDEIISSSSTMAKFNQASKRMRLPNIIDKRMKQRKILSKEKKITIDKYSKYVILHYFTSNDGLKFRFNYIDHLER